ncbi:MAG: hypothetical protein J6N52_00945, partial [Clostridia bacterium]|nr:hypothetical protein [Clostridia bacterium]
IFRTPFTNAVWRKRSKQIATGSDADVCLYFKSLMAVRCAAYLFPNFSNPFRRHTDCINEVCTHIRK